MIVKRGDIIVSNYGRGKVVAITRTWVIHEVEDGDEVCLQRGLEPMWLDADFPEEDVDATATLDVEGEGRA